MPCSSPYGYFNALGFKLTFSFCFIHVAQSCHLWLSRRERIIVPAAAVCRDLVKVSFTICNNGRFVHGPTFERYHNVLSPGFCQEQLVQVSLGMALLDLHFFLRSDEG